MVTTSINEVGMGGFTPTVTIKPLSTYGITDYRSAGQRYAILIELNFHCGCARWTGSGSYWIVWG